MESEDLLLLLIENMCRETPVGIEELPLHHIAHAQIALCHVSDVIAMRVHNDVFISLLEA